MKSIYLILVCISICQADISDNNEMEINNHKEPIPPVTESTTTIRTNKGEVTKPVRVFPGPPHAATTDLPNNSSTTTIDPTPKPPTTTITTTKPSTTTTTTTTNPTTTTIPTTSTTTTTTISTTTVTPTPTQSTHPFVSTTPVPVPGNRGFDGPSFIGGIVLASGLMAIGFVALKFYRARTELNYHTL